MTARSEVQVGADDLPTRLKTRREVHFQRLVAIHNVEICDDMPVGVKDKTRPLARSQIGSDLDRDHAWAYPIVDSHKGRFSVHQVRGRRGDNRGDEVVAGGIVGRVFREGASPGTVAGNSVTPGAVAADEPSTAWQARADNTSMPRAKKIVLDFRVFVMGNTFLFMRDYS